MEPLYPKGAKVKIRDPGEKPVNWNIKMMELVGCVSSVRRNGHHYPYRYSLQDWDWTWRHCDLLLLSSPELDPNSAFRNKKHAI